MNIEHTMVGEPGESQAKLADIKAAVRNLKPNRQQCVAHLFSELYPVIREMLDQKVTQKSILEVLEAHGLKLHPSRFKALMQAEASANSNNVTTSQEAAQ